METVGFARRMLRRPCSDLKLEHQKLRAFLCYSSGDKTTVRKLYRRLLNEGFIDPWFDEEKLKAGQDWQREIHRAVRNSDAVIVCLSHASISKAGFVQKEILYALDVADEQPEGSIFIIPLRLEKCGVPDRLSCRHWVNFFEKTGYRKLIDALQRRATDLGINEQTQNMPSIAVLPFDNLSADPDIEHLCDGLAGELINNLAKIEGLRVAARTSTFWFSGKKATFSKIGRVLSVDSILEGGVTIAGERVRIIIELVSVSSGHCLWAEEYDRQMTDIFDIQDEITLAVVTALKVKLLGNEQTAALKRYTNNIEAYELYLKGRFYFCKHTVEGWQRAIEYFEKAIQIESEYAPAFAGLSSVLAFAWFFGTLHPNKAIGKWRVANARALEIGANLEETHIAVGRFRFLYEWNWEETEREYKRAIELNPRNADAHQQYGLFLVSKGRLEEAITEGARAVELDPLSLLVNLHVGWIYWLAARWDDALNQVRRMIEIEPNLYAAYWVMGATLVMRGEYREAIKAYRKSLEMGGGYQVLSALAHTYGLAENRNEALSAIDQLLKVRKQRHATAYNLALAYGGLRENDKVFEWLEKAYRERNGELVYLKIHAELGTEGLWGKDFRNDARFLDLLWRVGFRS